MLRTNFLFIGLKTNGMLTVMLFFRIYIELVRLIKVYIMKMYIYADNEAQDLQGHAVA